jgi:hypothetical protein
MPQFNSGAAEQIGRFSEGLLLRLLQAVFDDAPEAQRQHKNALDGGPPVH